jgi:hypothetical protein
MTFASGGSGNAVMRFKIFGKLCMFAVQLYCTATGVLSNFSLPSNAPATLVNGLAGGFVGREIARTGNVWYGNVGSPGLFGVCGYPNNSSMTAGDVVNGAGSYEIA